MISTSNNKPSEVINSNTFEKAKENLNLNDNVNKERTLALISYNDNLEDILNHIEKEGFTIIKTKTLQFDLEQAKEFYASHATQNYYDKMVKWLSSGSNICALILEKENAVKDWRFLMGPTNYKKARKSNPNSIRAVFYKDAAQNATHGSDSDASVEKEIDFIFGDAAKQLPHTPQNDVENTLTDANISEKVKEKEKPLFKQENVSPTVETVPPSKNSTTVDQVDIKNVSPVVLTNGDATVFNEKTETNSISNDVVTTKEEKVKVDETNGNDVTPTEEDKIEMEEKIQTPIGTSQTPPVTEKNDSEKKETDEQVQPKERDSDHVPIEKIEDKGDQLKDTASIEKNDTTSTKQVNNVQIEERSAINDDKAEKSNDISNMKAEPIEETKEMAQVEKEDTIQQENTQEEDSVTTTPPSGSSENLVSTNASSDLDNEMKEVDITLEDSDSKKSSTPIKSESTSKAKKLKTDVKATKKPNGKETSRIRPPSIKRGQSGNIPASITGISRPTSIKTNTTTMNGSSKTTRIARLSPSATINKDSDKKKAPTTTTTTRDSGVPSVAKKTVTKVSRNLPRVAMMATQKPVTPVKKEEEKEQVEKKAKKKTSSTRSFISRLTAPTVASANKKAEADTPVVTHPKRTPASSKRSSIVRPTVSSSKDNLSRNNKQKKEEEQEATMNTNETELST